MAQLLIVSPDRSLLQIAQQSLQALGHHPIVAESVSIARRLFSRGSVDLLCLDSLVPADEAERCWRFAGGGAGNGEPAVLFFGPASAKLVPSTLPDFYRRDRDAIVAKPIDRGELERETARLLAGRARQHRADAICRVGSVALDGITHELLFADGGTLRLTPMEFKLVRCLMERAGEYLPADQLLEQVWGYPSGTGGPEIVRAHVSNLRRKLRTAGHDAQLLRTLPYRGYGFAPANGS